MFWFPGWFPLTQSETLRDPQRVWDVDVDLGKCGMHLPFGGKVSSEIMHAVIGPAR